MSAVGDYLIQQGIVTLEGEKLDIAVATDWSVHVNNQERVQYRRPAAVYIASLLHNADQLLSPEELLVKVGDFYTESVEAGAELVEPSPHEIETAKRNGIINNISRSRSSDLRTNFYRIFGREFGNVTFLTLRADDPKYVEDFIEHSRLAEDAAEDEHRKERIIAEFLRRHGLSSRGVNTSVVDKAKRTRASNKFLGIDNPSEVQQPGLHPATQAILDIATSHTIGTLLKRADFMNHPFFAGIQPSSRAHYFSLYIRDVTGLGVLEYNSERRRYTVVDTTKVYAALDVQLDKPEDSVTLVDQAAIADNTIESGVNTSEEHEDSHTKAPDKFLDIHKQEEVKQIVPQGDSIIPIDLAVLGNHILEMPADQRLEITELLSKLNIGVDSVEYLKVHAAIKALVNGGYLTIVSQRYGYCYKRTKKARVIA